MKIYIVGDHGPEHNSIIGIHKTHEGALKAWDKHRLQLLKDAKSFLEKGITRDKEMWRGIVKNLSCKDPEKIDNYPHETPYITEYKLEQ